VKTLLIILTGLLTLAVVILLVDIVPVIKRWIARIHIGQWKSPEKWGLAVKKVLIKQLRKTPSAPVSDNTRLTIIDRLKGAYKSKNLQNWQQAALLLGANELCGFEEVRAQVGKFIDSQIDPNTGEWQEWSESVDSAMLAFAILSSPVTNKQKIKPAMDKTAEMLFGMAEKYGTVPYNTNVPSIRFVDTVGMICPFLTKYGIEYDCGQAIETAWKQIEEYCLYGLHLVQKLPVHCFDVVSKAPLGIYAWGRGCGWLATGLMDSYLSLNASTMVGKTEEQNNPLYTKTNANIKMQENLFGQMSLLASALEKYQMENGGWDRQVFLKESGEASATAMLGWFMKKMFELTGDKLYKTSAEKARIFLICTTRRNGVVDYAQGDTKGIGFYSAKLDAMPAVQGFAGRII
jgi:unsaturated rhamnogalacturonyl hydrolase